MIVNPTLPSASFWPSCPSVFEHDQVNRKLWRSGKYFLWYLSAGEAIGAEGRLKLTNVQHLNCKPSIALADVIDTQSGGPVHHEGSDGWVLCHLDTQCSLVDQPIDRWRELGTALASFHQSLAGNDEVISHERSILTEIRRNIRTYVVKRATSVLAREVLLIAGEQLYEILGLPKQVIHGELSPSEIYFYHMGPILANPVGFYFEPVAAELAVIIYHTLAFGPELLFKVRALVEAYQRENDALDLKHVVCIICALLLQEYVAAGDLLGNSLLAEKTTKLCECLKGSPTIMGLQSVL